MLILRHSLTCPFAVLIRSLAFVCSLEIDRHFAHQKSLGYACEAIQEKPTLNDDVPLAGHYTGRFFGIGNTLNMMSRSYSRHNLLQRIDVPYLLSIWRSKAKLNK